MASRALDKCAMDVCAAGHGRHLASRVLQPPYRPVQGPLHPLFSPVPSVLRTVARRPLTARAGDLLAAGNGCAAVDALFQRLLLSLLPQN